MEVLSLNLIPTGTTPVVHVKQYDVGRTWRFELKEGPIVYTLDGSETIECDIKKKDGNVVTVAVTNTGASYIDIETTLQMTACSGDNLGAIRLKKGSDDIGTLNFILSCERSPLENGIESESSIHNLETQIAKAVADQYDSNNVFFDNVPTSGHGIGYAVTSEGVKTEVDNLNTALAGKVNTTDFDATNLPITSGSATNTKDYIDTGLSGKADTSSLSTVATSGDYGDLLNKPIHFRGTLGLDVMQVMKNLPDNSICCYTDSNNPTNQPTGHAWGSYFMYKTNGGARAYYTDNDCFAVSSRITSSSSSITWKIYT